MALSRSSDRLNARGGCRIEPRCSGDTSVDGEQKSKAARLFATIEQSAGLSGLATRAMIPNVGK